MNDGGTTKKTKSDTENITSLSLYGKDLRSIDIKKTAPNLKCLIIEGELDDDAQESLSKLLTETVNLQKIRITSTNLSFFPLEILNLKNLVELDFYINKISSLPSEIGRLTNLEELDLSANELISLPPEIGKLTKLKLLDLRENNITSLPSEIGKLLNLEQLLLSENELVNLPPEVWSLPNLFNVELDEDLSISRFINFDNDYNDDDDDYNDDYDNEYELISNEVKILDLSNKHLNRLPLDIIMCEKLTELNMSNNELIEVPAFLGGLNQLKGINVINNPQIDSIDKIPDAIFRIPVLEKIVLSEKGKNREYHQDEIAELREKRIIKINAEIRKIQVEMVIKYLYLRKEKITNEDLEESVIQKQKAFTKEHYLKSLINTLKAARNK